MHIVIFGATGKTGRHLVRQALARGHRVRAFTRSPAALHESVAEQGAVEHDARERDDQALEVFEGDARDLDAVRRAVAGVDAVLSVLHPPSNMPEHQVAESTGNILEAMRLHGVGRLVATAGAGVAYDADRPKLLNRIIKRLLLVFARHVYEDMHRTVQSIRASDVDWTVVRVPMLTDAPGGNSIRVGYVGIETGARIAREDVARFVLDVLEQGRHVHDAPVISN